MFDRYTHAARGDTRPASVGLGLNVVRTFVERIGGELAYHHHGSYGRFAVRLPSAAAWAPSAKERSLRAGV